MKKTIEKLFAALGYYPAKKLHEFSIEKPVAKKRTTIKKATTRTPKKEK
jgi:hypothetical protein